MHSGNAGNDPSSLAVQALHLPEGSRSASLSPSQKAQMDDKFTWLCRPSPTSPVAVGSGVDGEDGHLISTKGLNTNGQNVRIPPSYQNTVGKSASPRRSENQVVDHHLPFLSPREQRARVATALDRMGAGVVEVREAFQRWVPTSADVASEDNERWERACNTKRGGYAAATAKPATITQKLVASKLGSAAASAESTTSATDLEQGMIRAMLELRLPAEAANIFCKTDEMAPSKSLDIISFSDFVGRYASASGLLKEKSSISKGREVWAEGPGGMWMGFSRKELANMAAAFDEEAAKQEQDAESDDAGKL